MLEVLGGPCIYATDVLEGQLAPPGFECCEREFLGRSKRRVSDVHTFRKKINFLEDPEIYGDWMLWVSGKEFAVTENVYVVHPSPLPLLDVFSKIQVGI